MCGQLCVCQTIETTELAGFDVIVEGCADHLGILSRCALSYRHIRLGQ